MFTPEFRNRLDTIIQFETLTPAVIDKVVDKFIADLQARLTEKSVEATQIWMKGRSHPQCTYYAVICQKVSGYGREIFFASLRLLCAFA